MDAPRPHWEVPEGPRCLGNLDLSAVRRISIEDPDEFIRPSWECGVLIRGLHYFPVFGGRAERKGVGRLNGTFIAGSKILSNFAYHGSMLSGL